MTVNVSKQDTDGAIASVNDGEQLAIGGAYESADRFNHSLSGWQPSIQPVDQEISEAKELSEARVRDMRRNNARIDHGVRVNQDGIVGSKFSLNAKPVSSMLGRTFDEAWEIEFQEEVEAKFGLYAESSEGYIDAQGSMTFTDEVRLAVGQSVVSSEVLASVEWLGTQGRPYGTAIQFIDPDRLSTPMGQMDSSRLRNGIARDRFGAPVGYHIRERHPGDFLDVDKQFTWKFVRARKAWGRKNIIHIYEPLRPDQTRGISAMTAALKEMRMLSRFSDVALQNAVVNATYAMSIESELPAEAVYTALGAEGNADAANSAISSYATQYLAQLAQYSKSGRSLLLDGVKIPHLYPGTKLRMHPLGNMQSPGTQLEESFLRSIAASLGIAYEQFSLNFSDNSYSGIRASIGESQKHMTARKRMFADRFASSVYRLWLEEAIMRGHIESIPARFRNVDWLYSGQNLDALTNAQWIGAGQPVIDPLKEAKAIQVMLSEGLTTREAEAAKRGLDWREVDKQRAREMRSEQELGLHYGDTEIVIEPSDDDDDEDNGGNSGSPSASDAAEAALMSALTAHLTRDDTDLEEDEADESSD